MVNTEIFIILFFTHFSMCEMFHNTVFRLLLKSISIHDCSFLFGMMGMMRMRMMMMMMILSRIPEREQSTTSLSFGRYQECEFTALGMSRYAALLLIFF